MGESRIAAYGDSNCYWLLKKMLDFTSVDVRDPVLFSDSVKLDTPLYEDDKQLPSRRTDVNFSTYSAVVGKELICRTDSRFEVWETNGYSLQVRGRNKKFPGYPVIDLGRGLNSTFATSNKRNPMSTMRSKGESLGNKYLGLFYGDEVRNINSAIR